MSLKNEHGRYMHAWELFPVLGMKRGSHLPKEGWGARTVRHNGQVVWFRCLPATEGRRKHRIEYLCGWCMKWIPYGRAGQHIRAKTHKITDFVFTEPKED